MFTGPWRPGFRRGEIRRIIAAGDEGGPGSAWSDDADGWTPPSPPPADELRERAYRLYQAGDAVAAEEICRQLLAEDPRHAEAVYLLGVISLDSGRSGRVVRAVRPGGPARARQRRLRQRPGRGASGPWPAGGRHDLLPPGDRAASRVRTGSQQPGPVACTPGGTSRRPAACFAEAIRLNPRYATAHNNLGAVLQAQGRLDEAVAHFRAGHQVAAGLRGGALQPGQCPAIAGRSGRGRRQLPGGDPDPAVVRPRPISTLARSSSCCRRDYDALACYETAVRLQPDDAEMQRRLGDLLVLKKDWPAALAALERAVALKPDDPELFASLCSRPGSRSATGGPITPAWSGSGPTPKNSSPRGRRRPSSRSRR